MRETVTGATVTSLAQTQKVRRNVRLEEARAKKAAAVTLAKRIGPSAAAKQLSMSVNTLYNWIHLDHIAQDVAPSRRKVWPLAVKEHAVRLMESTPVPVVARQVGVSVVTLYKWRKREASGWKNSARDVRGYPSEFKEFAMLLAGDIGGNKAAAVLEFPRATMQRWLADANVKATSRRKHIRTSVADKKRAVEMCSSGMSVARVALLEGIAESTVRKWSTESREAVSPRASPRQYTPEAIRAILDHALAAGIQAAAEKSDVTVKRIRTWAKSRDITFPREKGLQVSADKQLRWLEKFYGMTHWQQLARDWIATQEQAISQKLQALRALFFSFIIKNQLPMEPELFLSRSARLPSFNGVAVPDTRHGRVMNNYARDFLSAVLYENFSTEDGYGAAVILQGYRNPLEPMGFADTPSHSQSVQPTLPYGFMEEMAKMLAEGPDFQEWRWAQSALGVEEGRQGTIGIDWFPVTQEMIDISDPDCVWRERVRGTNAGGPVLEMWSPVRWVALLMRYILPFRNFQVRVLDSGEADTFTYEGNGFGEATWTRNVSPLARGTEAKPHMQGVFRRPGQSVHAANEGQPEPSVYLFCNTNKTADIKRSGPQKGYVVPWPSDQPIYRNPYYWLVKLRNWQARYNCIDQPTPWSELEQSRHLPSKSVAQISQYMPTCFLFRLPDATSRSERHLPIPGGVLDYTHFAVMEELERRCAHSGRVSGNGVPLKFCDHEKSKALYPLHAMRTTLASALVFDGDMQIPELQQVLGHSTRWMSEYYAKQHPKSALASISEAMKKLEVKADATIEKFLCEAAFDEVESELAVNSDVSLSAALPRLNADRNPAGWMHLHHGLCLAGGNAHPIDGIGAVGGCYNGGANLGTELKPKYGPVEGGQRNCVRCRWFLTSPHYLIALHSHLNVCLYHLHTFQTDWAEKERCAEEIRLRRAEIQSTGAHFLNWKELDRAERGTEASLLRLTECAQTVAATFRLIRRCLVILEKHPASSSAQAFVAAGGPRDIDIALQHTSSELLQVSGVCEAAEVYPALDPGKAVLRYGQLLDSALRREGQLPMFVGLSETDQLKFGNAVLRSLGTALNPSNSRLGRVEVIELLEAEERLSDHIAIDLAAACANLRQARPFTLLGKKEA